MAGQKKLGTTQSRAWDAKTPTSTRILETQIRSKLAWTDDVKKRIAAAYKRILIQGILRQKPLPPSADGRHVPLNPPQAGPIGIGRLPLIDERSQKPYVGNHIRSTRYTVYDFLPKQLVFQFSKLGNFYFLVMGILQAIPGLSTVGQWTTIAPLGIFIAFSMANEGYHDYRRYMLDKSENRSTTQVFRHGLRGRLDQRGLHVLKDLMTRKHEKKKGKKSENTDIEAEAVAVAVAEADADADTDAVELQELSDDAADELGGTADWMSLQWKHVLVGDVVRLSRDEAAPADMVLLHATGPNGIAYIETMALDGETNLKAKYACPQLAEGCGTLEGLKTTQAIVVSEDPNTDLYSYDGRVIIDDESVPLSLNNMVYRGSILRNTGMAVGLVVNSGEECKIRMNAHKDVRMKKPAMQYWINMMILFQILIVILLATGLTIGYYRWEDAVEEHSWYLVRKPIYDGSVSFKEIFIGYLVMFNTLIPLSLYISLEIVKLGQLFLLHDAEMYDPVSDTPMVANTTTILENLGQVSHVFSDKTGTLTENMMRFRKMSVVGTVFSHDVDAHKDAEGSKENRGDDAVDSNDSQIKPAALSRPFTKSVSQWGPSTNSQKNSDLLTTEYLVDYIRSNPETIFSRKAQQFLLAIALCHTCLPEVGADGETTYQAASPDELALVEAARDMGFMLIDRPARSITLRMWDANDVSWMEYYQVLDVIEFSSQRKRMSIILRMPDGRICLFCKGADSVIVPRLKLSQMAEQKVREVVRRASIRKTYEQDKAIGRLSLQMDRATSRNSFATIRRSGDRFEGLRWSIGRLSLDHRRSWQVGDRISSLLQRRKTEETPVPWEDAPRSSKKTPGFVHHVGNGDGGPDGDGKMIVDSMAANDGKVFEKCFQHVNDFANEGLRTLLYAYRYIDEEVYASWKQVYREAETSLVDRQSRIEAASELIEQGFELAGATAIEDRLQEGVPETIDKLRRANIKVWMLTGDKRETAINIAQSARICKPFSEIYILDADQEESLLDSLTAALNDVGRGMVPHSVLVVDGQTLAVIDGEEQLALLFRDLTVRVDSVICCRASPSQKAKLVKSIRRHVPKSMTLAIGDGANDIAMIQASHVGIGISGREGLQAARISDYAIAQFRFLQRLLLVHGRWNYMRTGKYVLVTFWKEVYFYLMQAFFQRSTGYTGTSLFHSWSLTLLNSIFTSLPVILLGIFDRDLQADTLLAFPELYVFGQQGQALGFAQYFGWMMMAVISSSLTFYLPYGTYRKAILDQYIFAMGSVSFFVGVMFANVKILILEFHSKTMIPFIGLGLSILAWFIWNLAISEAGQYTLGPIAVREAFIHHFGHTLLWWTTLLLTFLTPILLELGVQTVRRVLWPTDQDLMQRMEKDMNWEKVLERDEGNGLNGDGR